MMKFQSVKKQDTKTNLRTYGRTGMELINVTAKNLLIIDSSVTTVVSFPNKVGEIQ